MYNILLEQLDKISMVNPGEIIAQLPPALQLKIFVKSGKDSQTSESMPRKAATANQFGFAAAGADSGAGGDDAQKQGDNVLSSDEAFHVRVLNLIADLTTNARSIK